MKKLFSLLLLSISIYSHAGDTSSTSKTLIETKNAIAEAVDIPDSASLSFSKIYTDVKVGISALASSLKVGSEHVYGILVKQQMVKSVSWCVMIAISLLPLLVFGKIIWKWAVKNHAESEGFCTFVAVIFFVMTIIPSIISIFYIPTIITGFVNPEYGAIKDIIDMVNPETSN